MLVLFAFLACNQSDVSEKPSDISNEIVSKEEISSPKNIEKPKEERKKTETSTPTFSGNAHASTSDTPDLLKGISKTGCDNGPGGAGAVSYFYDSLSIDDGVVSGSERWLMFANKQWKEKKGSDCEVVWSLKGKTRKPTRCAGCSMGITVTNDLDKGLSNCPEKMAKTNTGETINYDIMLNNDGSAVAYFSGSGKKFAEGYHKDGKVQLLSAMSCRWF
jgi:hypothetical protein